VYKATIGGSKPVEAAGN